jgi:hypothetical protein
MCVNDNAREDFVFVESATDGVRLLSEHPGGGTAIVVIPRDQVVEVSRRIRELARVQGNVRRIWDSSSHAKRISIIALLVFMALVLFMGAHIAADAVYEA